MHERAEDLIATLGRAAPCGEPLELFDFDSVGRSSTLNLTRLLRRLTREAKR